MDGDPLEAGMEQYSSVVGVPRTYSDNAALANDGAREYAFDEVGRLTRVGNALTPATLAENLWSSDGRRVLTREGATTTRFLYLGWQVVEERSGAGVVLRQYVDGAGLDEHVQMRDVTLSTDTYYHSNTLGSVGLLSSSTGQPLEAYEYSWLGRPRVLNLTNPGGYLSSSPRGNPYLFHGRPWDSATGLYDYRHRFYIPDIGEFASVDPLGKWTHGMGTGYEAFGGDGWNHSDPLGLVSWREVAGSAAGALIGSVALSAALAAESVAVVVVGGVVLAVGIAATGLEVVQIATGQDLSWDWESKTASLHEMSPEERQQRTANFAGSVVGGILGGKFASDLQDVGIDTLLPRPRLECPPRAPGRGPKKSPNFERPTNPPQPPPTELPPGHSVRVGEPCESYEDGYWVQSNGRGQPVDPSTGKLPGNVTRAQARARTHVPLPPKEN